jgi:hypothetical protein
MQLRLYTYSPLKAINILEAWCIASANHNIGVSFGSKSKNGFSNSTDPVRVCQSCRTRFPGNWIRWIFRIRRDSGIFANQDWVGTICIVKQAELTGEYVRSGILMVVGGTVVSNSIKVAS